jgi:hypothetical protein
MKNIILIEIDPISFYYGQIHCRTDKTEKSEIGTKEYLQRSGEEER